MKILLARSRGLAVEVCEEEGVSDKADYEPLVNAASRALTYLTRTK